MIEITNPNKFGKVVADAIAKVELTVKDSKTKTRWINAIAKATAEIEANGVFMTYQEEEKSLLIWSQKSNKIYTSNGVCQCRAFEQGSPCYHRAAARLVRLYLEPESESKAVINADSALMPKEIPYLKNTKTIKAERIANIRIN